MAHKVGEPKPVSVAVHDDGLPRMVDGRHVAKVCERWKVEDDWWKKHPINRCYYELIVGEGHNVVVYLDRVDGSWSKQRA